MKKYTKNKLDKEKTKSKKIKKSVALNRRDFVFYLFTAMFIGFVLGTHLSPLYKEKVVTKQEVIYLPGNASNGISVEMPIVAVDSQKNGVLGKLVTTAKPGTGLVLVNVNNVLAQYDTQLSGRTAARAASNFTKIDLQKWDIIYTIVVDATVIEGPSAGSVMAVSVIAALQNKTINHSIAMTGTINEDGSIDPAGGIKEKARTAKENGITTFLVAANQSQDTSRKSETECKMINGTNFCEVKYVETKTDLSKELNMSIIEVASISEAARYFFVE